MQDISEMIKARRAGECRRDVFSIMKDIAPDMTQQAKDYAFTIDSIIEDFGLKGGYALHQEDGHDFLTFNVNDARKPCDKYVTTQDGDWLSVQLDAVNKDCGGAGVGGGYSSARYSDNKTKKAQVLYGSMGGKHDKYYKRILELAEQYCPHATKIYAGFSTDIVWDLPSGNHPGLFISIHGGENEQYYTCDMTAWNYLDFPENTSDGEMPPVFGVIAKEMYDKSNGGGISEFDLIEYMKEMDRLCDELARGIYKSKTRKSLGSYELESLKSTIKNIITSSPGMRIRDSELMGILMQMPEYRDYIESDFQDAIDSLVTQPWKADQWNIYYDANDLFASTEFIKSKTEKGETKIPVSDDDTVEIEEMDGKRYVEIEPKDEHAEEVATGYEKESDDLNIEDNITHPDTSKPKKSNMKKSVDEIIYTPEDSQVWDSIINDFEYVGCINGPDGLREFYYDGSQQVMYQMLTRDDRPIMRWIAHWPQDVNDWWKLLRTHPDAKMVSFIKSKH